jgi:hypothetical protein
VKVVIGDRLQHGRSCREIVHETWTGLFADGYERMIEEQDPFAPLYARMPTPGSSW